jgi:hypothetical protein
MLTESNSKTSTFFGRGTDFQVKERRKTSLFLRNISFFFTMKW